MFVRIESISWVFSNQSSPFLAVPLTIGNFVALEIRINGSTRYCWVHICQAVRYIRYQVKADKVCSWNICEQKYFKAVSFRLHMNYEKPFYTLTHLTSLWSRALPFSQLSSPVQFCCRKNIKNPNWRCHRPFIANYWKPHCPRWWFKYLWHTWEGQEKGRLG